MGVRQGGREGGRGGDIVPCSDCVLLLRGSKAGREGEREGGREGRRLETRNIDKNNV